MGKHFTLAKKPFGIACIALFCLFCLSESYAQSRRISGKVTSKEETMGIPGVNVLIKGTQVGTATNIDGDFSLDVPDNNTVLIFSYIGFQNQEVTVGNRSVINVELVQDEGTLGEVVVTALGIRREEISLGYSIERVGGDEMTRVAQESFLNAMAGKVAGATISSTGGTGSSVSMVIRGATSLSSDNQPLFVVDGVPIANTLNNVSSIGNENRVDYGNAISGLNPDDIAEITILKGPSAAALYGSRAGNGVVLITTKSGKVDRLTVNVSSNTVFDVPFKFLKWHSRFGSGQFSAIPPDISGSPLTNPFGALVQENVNAAFGAELDRGYMAPQWNSPLDEQGRPIPMELVSHPNNVQNFMQTGITTTNGFSVSNSTASMNYRISYGNMQNRGIIPNADLFRNTLNINSSVKMNDKLTLSTNLDVSRNNSNNRPAGERGTNPLQWVYETSPHINILDLKDYWMPGQEGLQQRSPDASFPTRTINNPYFLAYEVNNSFTRDRVFGNIKADWQISPSFSAFARYALDTYSETRESKIANSYTQELFGAYGITELHGFESNADFLVSYNKDVNNFGITLSGGGNMRYQNGSNMTVASRPGGGLIVPGVYTIQNIAQDNVQYSNARFERGINSLYALANLSYKDMIYLDLTARNDWSSTLPNADPYFYPSASLSLLVNEMVNLPSSISLFKLRGGYAQVGNDADPYRLIAMLSNAGAWGNLPRLTLPSTLLNPTLKPEIASSYEAGLDMQLFNGRVRFAGTYYVMENENQILSTLLPPSTGYTSKSINAGLLRSRGIELTLGSTIVENRNWRWDLNLNLTRNRTRILELSDDLPFYTLWTDARGGAWTYVGDEIGDIYDAQVITVEDPNSPYFGFPILNPQSGKWQDVAAQNTRNKIGNFNPRFILGGQSALSYKNFHLNFTFDWRNGGDFVSQTYRWGEEHGRSQIFLDKLINPGDMQGRELRDYLIANKDQMILMNGNNFPLVGGPTPEFNGYPFTFGPFTLPYGGVFIPGVYATAFDENGNPTEFAENLGENIGQPGGTVTMPFAGSTAWSFTRAFLYPASFVKLREVSFGMDLPARITSALKMQNLNFSVYSRNIILWTAAKINIDPEMAFQPQAGVQAGTQFKQGIERWNVNPWVMPIGFKVNATF
ncbi:MAG: SusC/RagA family TonB-linked outer membrane protein [Lunatimonas sp.]|uniref:SusC/RagA family TonB-linked outer membrane protein n=1 Tax=Lunatimonas sp. TaxID=2060141 RepID=UPI00263ADFB8|nr:SusC/RagA family TonB-linked outer membrane protein [Lunatimonas sp.]MCC5938517.1 SusC/RagA family TonB-linked outer membrane protein [Lunatimonas sp.]